MKLKNVPKTKFLLVTVCNVDQRVGVSDIKFKIREIFVMHAEIVNLGLHRTKLKTNVSNNSADIIRVKQVNVKFHRFAGAIQSCLNLMPRRSLSLKEEAAFMLIKVIENMVPQLPTLKVIRLLP
jgi:hypothetical protein